MELESLLKPISLRLRMFNKNSNCGHVEESLIDANDIQQIVKLTSDCEELSITSDSVQFLLEIISTLTIRELCDQTKLLCLDLLNNLVATDTSLANQLREVIPTLLTVVEQCMEQSGNCLILPCLQLLQKVAYRSRPLPHLTPLVEKFLSFLSQRIRSQPADSPLVPYLVGCLSSFTRHSLVVQLYLKEQPNVTFLYRTLVSYLSHSNLSVIVYSLSTLLSLCFNEPLGDKLFSKQNIHQTFQLMFGMLVKSPSYVVTEHAVDLFLDSLHHEKVRQSLTSYPHLEQSLMALIGLINPSLDDLSASKLLELMNHLMVIGCIHRPLTKLSFSQGCHKAYQAILQWAGIGHNQSNKLQLNSIKFLKHLAEGATTSGLALSHKSEMTSLLTSAVAVVTVASEMGCLESAYEAQVIAESLTVALVCSQHESQEKHVVQSITPDVCHALYMMSLEHSSLVQLPHLQSCYNKVTIQCLQLMVQLTSSIPEMSLKLNMALVESRLSPVLAQSLTSSSKDRVIAVLKLLKTVLQTPHFQLVPLAFAVAEMNSDVGRLASLPSPILKHKSGFQYNGQPKSESSQPELQQLIDRMKNRLDIKDAKASDIIDVYEHKLASLQTREGQLQDLLDAKTMALSQADQIISQYRARQASSETDIRKVALLLQKSDREQEILRQQLKESERERSEADGEIEGLVSKVESLEEVVKQHRQLVVSHAELQQSMENLQETMTAQREENHSLSAMLETLQQHDESLKKQLDCVMIQIQQLEVQRQQLEEQLGEKEASAVDLKQALKEQEAISRKHENEKKKIKNEIGELCRKISQTETARVKQEERIQCLEETCRQQERTISQHRKELEKHAQIVAMIHNMTSGKS